MRQRATLLGGTLEAGPRPAGGFQVTAVLPVPRVAGQGLALNVTAVLPLPRMGGQGLAVNVTAELPVNVTAELPVNEDRPWASQS